MGCRKFELKTTIFEIVCKIIDPLKISEINLSEEEHSKEKTCTQNKPVLNWKSTVKHILYFAESKTEPFSENCCLSTILLRK